MRKYLLGLAAAAAMCLPLAAGAVTVVDDGDSVIIPTTDTQFIGNVTETGGAGSETVLFTSIIDPLGGTAVATIGNINFSLFTDLTVSWISDFDGLVLATAAIGPGFTTLSTVFSSPFDLAQNLVFEWSDSAGVGGNFDYEVSAVPLPAAGWLLIAALGGMGAMARRKKAAA